MNVLKIDVTEELIRTGKRGDACSCPVALAAWAAGLENVEVDGAFLSWDSSYGDRCEVTVPNLEEFVERFDGSEMMTVPNDKNKELLWLQRCKVCKHLLGGCTCVDRELPAPWSFELDVGEAERRACESRDRDYVDEDGQ